MAIPTTREHGHDPKVRAHRFDALKTAGRVATALLAAPLLLATTAVGQQLLTLDDIGLTSRFQDSFGGDFKHGRAMIAADFDLDGKVDFFVGNPGNASFILRNVTGQVGAARFAVGQQLFENDQAWGGVAFDYDNDGDYDLFVSIGGNEGIGHDFLFRNDFLETGLLSFQDVTDIAGVAGPVPPGTNQPLRTASGNAAAADYDLDGDVDLFVGTIIKPQSLEELKGRNTLWRNNDDGTFTDVTDAVGLGLTAEKTRHSSFIDFDNDGDFDLYENNYVGPNYVWRNLLKETGSATFEDATDELTLPGEDMHYPHRSFASTTADFNNDGWDDLMVWSRGDPAGGGPQTGSEGPYPPGHALFLNRRGKGFINVADQIGLNITYQPINGVMGCQVGDVNGDGTPDIYTGNGGPPAGQFNQLLLSQGGPRENLSFIDTSVLIDYPAPEGGTIVYPSYPYRTHGTAIVDVDGDGLVEIAVANGGPTSSPYLEPNRLFRANFDPAPGTFRVRVIGNGTSVSKDAIGTRLSLSVQRSSDGTRWVLHRTLAANSAFSAQNGFETAFALGDADSIRRLEIQWPDGTRSVIGSNLNLGGSLVVEQGSS